MSLARQIAKNTFIQFIGKIIGIFLGVLTVAIMTRYLGTDGFGQYSTITAYLQFFGIMVDMGLSLIIIRLLADPEFSQTKIINNVFTLRFFSALLFLGLAPLVVLLFPYDNIIKIGVAITTLSFFASSLNQILISLFQKELKMLQVTLAETAGRLVLFVLVFYFAYQDMGLLAIMVAVILGSIVNFLLNYIFAKKFITIKFSFDWLIWKKIILQKGGNKMLDMFNICGIGQAGCRISKEFAKIGFETCYINSDVVDMRDLNVSSEKILMLDSTGSGRSPIKGREILKKNFNKFAAFMDKNLNPNGLNIFILGLGGGTGGGMIVPALEYASKKGCKTGIIATLPARMSGIIEMSNAMKSLKELKDINTNMFILADNDFLTEKVGLSSEWWQKINNFILRKIAVIFDLLRENKTSQAGIGSIDKAELMRILQYGQGLLDVRDIYLSIPIDTSLPEEELRKKLCEPGLIAGYKYNETLFYLVNIDVPKQGGFTELASSIFSICKSMYGNSLARLGMFIDPSLDKTIRVTIINAGLKMPRVLRSRMNNLKRDSDRLEEKKGKGDSLDFSTIDNIDIDKDFDI